MAGELEQIYTKITDLESQIKALGDISDELRGKIMQKFRLDWNYHSNAIEGNKLTYGETIAFLMEGLTAKGKPLKDHLDIRGHNEAINFLIDMVKQNTPLTEIDIRGLHKMILVESYESPAQTPDGKPVSKRINLGKYKEMPNHVKTVTGEIHYYASPEETPAKMQELVEWYNTSNASDKFHPLELAARFHHRFTAIHPFDDGNGRLGRILMNLILMQHHLPPIVVKQEDRDNYYSVLNQADNGLYEPLLEYLGNLLVHSLEIYLRGAKGESIDEPSDLDKEIALFKKGFTQDDFIKVRKSLSSVNSITTESIFPLFNLLGSKVRMLNDLFDSHLFSIKVKYADENDEKTLIESKLKWTIDRPYSKRLVFNSDEEIYSLAETSVVDKISYQYTYIGFKKAETPFNCILNVEVIFDEYKYRIYYGHGNSTSEINNFYDKQLTEKEMQDIVSIYIKQIMLDIETQSH